MESSGGRFIFQQRKEKIDWRKLAAVDIEQISRDVDVDAIQENILSVTYCDIEHELGYQKLDPNFIKLFRLAQLTIEYLLYCQEYLQQCIQDKENHFETANIQTQHVLSEHETMKADLAKRNESYKNLKKELQKCRKLIADYQLMIRAGASGLHKCPCCSKSFVSEYYLRSHIERRHPEEAMKSQPNYPITINHSYHGDTELLNELNDIKSRLKQTEDELLKERQSNKEEKLWESALEEVRNEHQMWKHEEEEKMKVEIEKYKSMIMDELKESRKENQILKKTLQNLENDTGKKKSNLGVLLDEDDRPDDWLNDKLREMEARFHQQIAQMREDHKIEMRELKNDRKRLLAAERAKKENVEKELEENRRFFTNQINELKQELTSKHSEDHLTNKFEETEKNSNQRKLTQHVPTASLPPPPKDSQLLKSPSHEVPEKEPNIQEKDLVQLWISTKSNGHQSFRVFRHPASTKGGWRDVFTFTASLIPVGEFQKAIYVFSCGGSPYWRQYVSTSSEPPAPNYKLDFKFYVSLTKVIGTSMLYVHEAGKGTSVVRSLISRDEAVPSMKYSGVSFFVLSSGVNKANLSRSGTFNSSFGSTDEDDEVTLSSLTVTDAAKQNLAEEIKRSRENLLIEGDNVEEFKAIDTDDEEESANEVVENNNDNDLNDDDSVINRSSENHLNKSGLLGEDENSHFGASSSGSLLGSTIPEKGEFQLFASNPLAKSKYNHSQDRLKLERENILEVLEDNLEKHGVDSSERFMPTAVFQSKMKLHEKETQMIEKKYRGFTSLREQFESAIHNAAILKWASKNKKKAVKTFKKAANVVTACASPKKQSSNNDVNSKPVDPSRSSGDKEYVIDRFESKYGSHGDNDVFDASDDYDDDDDPDYEQVDNIRNTNSKNTVRQNNNAVRHIDDAVSDDDDDFEVSESSEWDSEDGIRNNIHPSGASVPPAQDYGASVPSTQDYDDEQEYRPKLRSPKGEKVKKLAADLEASLTMRDKSRKKPAGAVDLHTQSNEGEGTSVGQGVDKAKRSVSFREHNDELQNFPDDFDEDSDYSATSFEASKNNASKLRNTHNAYDNVDDDDDDDDDIDAMLANYKSSYKPSASSTPHSNKHRTPITALNLDDFDDDSI